MVSLPALFTESASIVTLHCLYALLDETCRSSCDVDLECCAALCAIAARPQGFDIREARASYSLSSESGTFELLLKERELIEVVRSTRDRRALAFRITPKGRDRVALAQRMLGACLVQEHPGLTEQSFDQLVKLSYDYAVTVGFPAQSEGLFPAPVLRDLAAYQRRVELVAARFGMTSSQTALLLDCCSNADLRRSSTAGRTRHEGALGLPPWMLEAERDRLCERGFLSIAGAEECTEAAIQRISEFTQRLIVAIMPWWQANNPRSQAAVVKLLQYVLYLFS